MPGLNPALFVGTQICEIHVSKTGQVLKRFDERYPYQIKGLLETHPILAAPVTSGLRSNHY